MTFWAPSAMTVSEMIGATALSGGTVRKKKSAFFWSVNAGEVAEPEHSGTFWSESFWMDSWMEPDRGGADDDVRALTEEPGHRLPSGLGRLALVALEELHVLAVDAARGVDVVDRELRAHDHRWSEEGQRPGVRQHPADRELLAAAPAARTARVVVLCCRRRKRPRPALQP